MKKWLKKHPEKVKEYMKRWQAKNKEKIKEYQKKWRVEHSEYVKKWWIEHPEKRKQYSKKWRIRHLRERNEYMKRWWAEHPEKRNQQKRKWRKEHPEKTKEIARLELARRKRDYPTNIILNEYFEGSHLHHLTPWVAIYIPDEMHKSIWHNLRTGKNMYEINRKALDFWLGKSGKV